MPETLAKVILARKAKRMTKETGTRHISPHDRNRVPLSQSLKVALIRPFQLMFLEPIILFMSFYLSFVYSLLYATFFAFPIAFEEIRGWNMGMTGVSFVSIIVSWACWKTNENMSEFVDRYHFSYVRHADPREAIRKALSQRSS